MPRRRAGPPRSEAERFISAGAAQSALGRGALHRRAPGGGPRRCLWRAPCSRPYLPRPARRSRRGRLPSTAPAGAVRARSRRALRRSVRFEYRHDLGSTGPTFADTRAASESHVEPDADFLCGPQHALGPIYVGVQRLFLEPAKVLRHHLGRLKVAAHPSRIKLFHRRPEGNA